MISRDGKDIAPFFEPESIAVIGSFREGIGLGHGTVRNLLNFGFGGGIFPISGTCDEVLGLRTLPPVGRECSYRRPQPGAIIPACWQGGESENRKV